MVANINFHIKEKLKKNAFRVGQDCLHTLGGRNEYIWKDVPCN